MTVIPVIIGALGIIKNNAGWYDLPFFSVWKTTMCYEKKKSTSDLTFSREHNKKSQIGEFGTCRTGTDLFHRHGSTIK